MEHSKKELFENLIYKNIQTNSDVAYKEVIAYFDKQTVKERKAHCPWIASLYSDYWNTRTLPEGCLALELLKLAGYYCMDKKKFEELSSGMFPNKFAYHDVIGKFQPDWLNSFLNEYFPSFMDIGYDYLAKYIQKGYLVLSRKALVFLLSYYFHKTMDRKQIEGEWVNIPIPFDRKIEGLLRYEITLKEHFWILFEELQDTYHYMATNITIRLNVDKWIEIIEELLRLKKIDRLDVLRHCFRTVLFEFKKFDIAGYFSIISHLKPTPKELLSLQADIILVLQSPFNAQIKQCLNYLKLLLPQKEFKKQALLEQIPTLLLSPTKSMVRDTLKLLSLLVKHYPKEQANVVKLLPNALLIYDEKLQIECAKRIVEWAEPTTQPELEALLRLHTDGLFSSVRELLNDFLSEETQSLPEEELLETQNAKMNKKEALSLPKTFEDSLFYLAENIEDNVLDGVNLFCAVLLQMDSQIIDEKVELLQPLLKRSHKLERYSIIACLVVEYSDVLIKRYPQTSLKLQKLQQKEYASKEFVPLAERECHQQMLTPLWLLCNLALERIQKRQYFSFLSTPTHTPAWLDMATLIKRIEEHQKYQIFTMLYDFQVALARVDIEEEENLLPLVEQMPQSEAKEILLYLLGNKNYEACKVQQPSLWIVPIMRRKDFKLLEKCIEEQDEKQGLSYLYLFEKETWKITKKKSVELSFKNAKALEKLLAQGENTKLIKERTHRYGYWPRRTSEMIYKEEIRPYKVFDIEEEYQKTRFLIGKESCTKLPFRSFYAHLEPDTYPEKYGAQLLYLSPHQPEICLLIYIKIYLRSSSFMRFSEVDDEKLQYNMLLFLSRIWSAENEVCLLFLACSMCYLKKDTRQLAAGIWIEQTTQNNMNHALLGECLGKIAHEEYIPLKRFTDLIAEQLFNLTKEHNQALQKVLENMIVAMETPAVKGTKKLLELYFELLNLNQSKLPEGLLDKLKEEKSLKALCHKMIKDK